MARDRTKYGTALGILHGESEKGNVNKNTQENGNKIVQENGNKNVTKDVDMDVNILSKQDTETKSLDDLSKSINNMFKEKSKKKTMEETHTRKTFLIENELLKEFDRLTKNKRGYQTMLINEVLRAVLDAQK